MDGNFAGKVGEDGVISEINVVGAQCTVVKDQMYGVLTRPFWWVWNIFLWEIKVNNKMNNIKINIKRKKYIKIKLGVTCI